MSPRDIFPLSGPTRQAELAEAYRQLEELAKRASATPRQTPPRPFGLKKRKKKFRLLRLAEEAATRER